VVEGEAEAAVCDERGRLAAGGRFPRLGHPGGGVEACLQLARLGGPGADRYAAEARELLARVLASIGHDLVAAALQGRLPAGFGRRARHATLTPRQARRGAELEAPRARIPYAAARAIAPRA